MKTRLRLLYFSILVCCIFGFNNKTYAQINYSQDFEIDEGGWSDEDFFAFYFFPCTGENALTGEIYSDPDFGDFYAPVTISPSLGNSNGLQATLTYSYSLIDWNTFAGVTNTPDWGEFSIEYSSSPSGPWTNLQTIDPSNHVESDGCAVKTVTFTPAVGPVYLRISGTPNDYIDVLINIDDISVVQQLEACSGTPAASSTVADQATICNGGTVNLSLAPAYTSSGLVFQWQSSADGVSYSNVPTGGTSATYSTTQAASMWYRANISCGAGAPVTSTPVHVINSGMPCLCDVAFDDDIEPITHVVFAGIDNTTDAAINGTPGDENFTNLDPAEVTPGETYDITLEGNTNDPDGDGYETYFTVFIDWNQDGDFEDDSEKYDIDYIIYSDGEDGVQATGEIEVPAGALPGLTYMRVFKLYDQFPDMACGVDGEFGYGQVEDYLVHVAAPSTETLDYVNLQWPATMTFAAGGSDTAYAQAWEDGVTNAPGQGAGVTAWIGISPVGSNTNPNTWTTWVPATYNAASTSVDNDEYMATIGTGLTPGTYYYASRFQLNGGPYTYGGYTPTGGGYWDGVTNISGVLTVTCATAAPTAAAAQTLCQGSTIADIDVTGTSIAWYSAATGGTALPATTVLTNGTTYHASATAGGCESVARTAVTVNITVTPAPTATETIQTFCNAANLDDLEVDGDGEIMWYLAQTGGNALPGNAVLGNNVTYYASQSIDGCESTTRTAVTAHVTVSNAPTGSNIQEIEVMAAEDATIEDIEVTATGSVNWYYSEEDAEAGEDAIAPETVIVSGTYYATQTINGCESAPFAVAVDITLGNEEFNTAAFRYHPNPVKDVLTISYAKNISAIEVYNIVGQKVIVKSVNQNEAQLDMSPLAAGTYMVKVVGDTASKTIKVVKQ